MAEKKAGAPVPEPESTYTPAELIDNAKAVLGVAPEAVAGALSGRTEPLTVAEAREMVAAFLNREVR